MSKSKISSRLHQDILAAKKTNLPIDENPYADLIREGEGKISETSIKEELHDAEIFRQKLNAITFTAKENPHIHQFHEMIGAFFDCSVKDREIRSTRIRNYIAHYYQDLDLNVEILPGRNLLSIAIEYGDSELTELLIDYQANLNQEIGKKLESPLHFAIKQEQYEISSQLTRQSKVNMSVLNTDNQTPLMLLNEKLSKLKEDKPPYAQKTLNSLESNFKKWYRTYLDGKKTFYGEQTQEDQQELELLRNLSGPELLESDMYSKYLDTLLRNNVNEQESKKNYPSSRISQPTTKIISSIRTI